MSRYFSSHRRLPPASQGRSSPKTASQVAQRYRTLLPKQESGVGSLGQEDALDGGDGHPLQYACPEKPRDRGAWRATSPWGRRESDTPEHKQAHNAKKGIQKLGLIRAHLIQPLQRKQRNEGCLVWRKEKHDSLIREGGLRVRNPRVQKIACGQAGRAQTAAKSSCVNSRDRRGIRYGED